MHHFAGHSRWTTEKWGVWFVLLGFPSVKNHQHLYPVEWCKTLLKWGSRTIGIQNSTVYGYVVPEWREIECFLNGEINIPASNTKRMFFQLPYQMTPYNLVDVHKYFGPTYSHHKSITLKMEPESSSEMLLPIYQTAQQYIPEGRVLNAFRRGDLKSHI